MENYKKTYIDAMSRMIIQPSLFVAPATVAISCLGFAHGGNSIEASVTKPQPNIVHILTDDLGWQDMACYYRTVRGQTIETKVNGKTVIRYTEPANKKGTRKLSEGTFGIQAHDPGSIVLVKNIMVKPLASKSGSPGKEKNK